MKNKNLKLFADVYDMILELNGNDFDEAFCIAGSIIAKYDWNRINYAIENNWHLYDLDRWEAVAREYGRDPERLEALFDKNGIVFAHEEYVQIMRHGDLFLKEIVTPLYENGIEVMDLMNLSKTRNGGNCQCRDI